MLLWCAEGIEPPVGGRTARFAVGRPDGMSSNSWVVSTTGRGDIYIIGRDNFRESKVSLHQSGKWRLGETERAALERPDLVPEGADRAAVKWERPDSWGTETHRAFQVITVPMAVYLAPEARAGWSRKVVFIEPPANPAYMTAVDVWAVPDGRRIEYPDYPAITLAVLKLVEGLTVHVIAAHEPGTYEGLDELGTAILEQSGDLTPDVRQNGVALVFGSNEDGSRLLMPLPLNMWP